MRAFLIAIVATIVIAASAAAILDRFQEPVAQVFTTDAVRLDKHS